MAETKLTWRWPHFRVFLVIMAGTLLLFALSQAFGAHMKSALGWLFVTAGVVGIPLVVVRWRRAAAGPAAVPRWSVVGPLLAMVAVVLSGLEMVSPQFQFGKLDFILLAPGLTLLAWPDALQRIRRTWTERHNRQGTWMT